MPKAPEGAASAPANRQWSKAGFEEGGEPTVQVTGKYSAEESEIVRKAVEDYCAMRQLDVARLCSECSHKAELKGAWMEIAKCLPHRGVQSVYRHGIRQLHPWKRGPWTEEECDALIELVGRHGKKWATIQKLLNRSADACRDKYRECSQKYDRGRWNAKETELLKRLIRDHLQVEPTSDIKELGKMVERQGIKIPWMVVSNKMKNRSRLACYKKWQKMTGLLPSSSSNADAEAKDPPQPAPARRMPKNRPAVRIGGARKASSASRATVPSSPSAPTAGAAAAAALAAAAAANVTVAEVTANGNFDIYLLTELASMDVTRTSDIDWDALNMENAQERWGELYEEWLATYEDEEEMLCLPVSEMAQAMLERKTSAQAAETVEALNLPPSEALKTAKKGNKSVKL